MKKILFFVTIVLLVSVAVSSKAQSSSQATPTTLDINRSKIDSLDNRIIQAIGLRERLVEEIGLYKAKNHIPPLQSARFQDVLKRSVAAGKEQRLSEEFVTELMNAIHKESLRIENKIKDDNR